MMQDAHALVVGVANYQSVRKLPEAVLRDACDLRDLLVNPHICGYPDQNVILLLDAQATLEGLRGALAALAERASPNSTVFIYISGHGARLEQGRDQGEYILPVDARAIPPAATPELLASSALSGAEFSAALQAVPARKVVVVFDCCHSGGVGALKAPGIGSDALLKDGLSDSYYDRLAAGRGRVILASSRDTEFSSILAGAANSLFTHHLKAALLGAAPADDGYIHIFDLFEYVHPKVTSDAPPSWPQHPVLYAKVEENFPVALYLGGQKAPAAPGGETERRDGDRYDVYISWVRAEGDMAWMRERLLPAFKAAGLRMAMTGRVEEPGVPAVIGIQRAVELSRRTLVLLSRAYLESAWAELEQVAALHLSVEERRARLLPVVIDERLLDGERRLNRDVPLSLRQLSALDLTDEFFGEENLVRLPALLKQPVPRLS
jgi:hypothetical protein